jgi:PAT family beta-lactamase induction signal transducer AmpG
LRRIVNFYLAESRWLRFSALCVLYVSQGLPDGFVRTGLKTYLIREGASTPAIAAIIASVSWPWAVKWIWGPVIDRFSGSRMGRRRPWIIAAQVMMMLMLAGILLIPDLSHDTRLLAFAVLAINCFSSMQDVAIDALAIDTLHERERGIANALMFGSADVGRFLGGAVIGGVLLAYGLRQAIGLEIVILLVIAACPIFIRERRGDALLPWQLRTPTGYDSAADVAATPSMVRLLLQLKAAFARRSALLAAVLAGCSLMTTSAHLVFWPVYVQRQLGWSSVDWLSLEGAYGVGCGLAGSLLGGVVATWIGAKRGVMLISCGLAACWFAYAMTAPWWHHAPLVAVLFCAGAALTNAFQVAMFALFMGICRGPVAATQFSAYMALLNVSGSMGAMLAGLMAPSTSLLALFASLGVFQLGLVILAALIGAARDDAFAKRSDDLDSQVETQP